MQLSVTSPAPSSSAPRESAALLLNPSFQALTAIASCEPMEDTQTEMGDVFAEIQAIVDAVTGGDMKHPEAITVAQATALNVMFAKLSRLAFHNVSNPEFNSLMRLAFRAQAQCVRALETLTSLRNPSIFTRQLNVANQQIVNNSPSTSMERGLQPASTTPPLPPALHTADPNLVRFAESDKIIPHATPPTAQT
jgi:hypothetical protein